MSSPELNEQLKAIEARLSNIEKKLYITSPSELPRTIRATAPASVQQEQQPKPPAEARTRTGNWLGIVAVICFVLAAGFIIKLSIESGWLTLLRQFALTVIFGFSLIGAGLMLLKSDKEYASFLPAGGIIILYLAAFAAHRFYGLISFDAAIGYISLISAICIWLHMTIKHDIYPITAAIGAYIAPLLLGLDTTVEFSLYYFVICSLVFASISIWTNSRILTIIAAYLAVLVNTYIGLDLSQNDLLGLLLNQYPHFNVVQDKLIATVLVLHFLIFSISTYFYSRQNRHPLTLEESWGFLLALVIFYAAEYYFINRIAPGIAPWYSLGFAGVLIGVYLASKSYFANTQENLHSRFMIIAFTTVVLFHSVYLELLPADFRPWLFVIFAVGFALCPNALLNKEKTGTYTFPIMMLLLIMLIEYGTMILHLTENTTPTQLLVSLFAFASMWFVLLAQPDFFHKQDEYHYPVLSAAHLIAIMAFYQLTHSYNSLAVSASWLFYAICVILFAFSRKDKIMAKSALFVLSLAAAKALLYDASSAATIVRIFCLLITGIALYGAGFFLRKIDQWEN